MLTVSNFIPESSVFVIHAEMDASVVDKTHFLVEEVLVSHVTHLVTVDETDAVCEFLVCNTSVHLDQLLSNLVEGIRGVLLNLQHFSLEFVAGLHQFPLPNLLGLVVAAGQQVAGHVKDATVFGVAEPSEQPGVGLADLVGLHAFARLILPHCAVEILLVCALVLEFFLELLVVVAE